MMTSYLTRKYAHAGKRRQPYKFAAFSRNGSRNISGDVPGQDFRRDNTYRGPNSPYHILSQPLGELMVIYGFSSIVV